MEKGLDRLREAAVAIRDMGHDGDPLLRMEVTPEGVRCKITWQHNRDKKFYTLENLTPWSAIHPRPNTKNPLISALDMLVKGRTEFEG